MKLLQRQVGVGIVPQRVGRVAAAVAEVMRMDVVVIVCVGILMESVGSIRVVHIHTIHGYNMGQRCWYAHTHTCLHIYILIVYTYIHECTRAYRPRCGGGAGTHAPPRAPRSAVLFLFLFYFGLVVCVCICICVLTDASPNPHQKYHQTHLHPRAKAPLVVRPGLAQAQQRARRVHRLLRSGGGGQQEGEQKGGEDDREAALHVFSALVLVVEDGVLGGVGGARLQPACYL